MARTINEQEFENKRLEILSSARRMVYSKGYECMTIHDILADLKISSGAFYHYFDSKPAVLEALIERMQQEAEEPLFPIIRDSNSTAVEKFQLYFAMLDQTRFAQKEFLSKLLRVWYTDGNAIVRQKVDDATLERRAPLLAGIIQQGIDEGVFRTDFPEQMGKVILSLALGMNNSVARIMLSFFEGKSMPEKCAEEIVATNIAYLDAMERALGATQPFLTRPDVSVVRHWLGKDD